MDLLHGAYTQARFAFFKFFNERGGAPAEWNEKNTIDSHGPRWITNNDFTWFCENYFEYGYRNRNDFVLWL